MRDMREEKKENENIIEGRNAVLEAFRMALYELSSGRRKSMIRSSSSCQRSVSGRCPPPESTRE